MNIVLVSSLLIPKSTGGVEVLTVLLAKALSDLGHHVTIYTGGHNITRFIDRAHVIEIPELSLPLHLKSFFMPYYAWRLRMRLRNDPVIRNADIINAVDLDSIIALAGWRSISKKFIPTIQDYGLICANGLLLHGTHVCPNYCHMGQGFRCLDKRKLSIAARIYLELAYRIRTAYRNRKIKHISRAICVSTFTSTQVHKIYPHIHTSIIGNCLPEAWQQLKLAPYKNRTIDILYAGRLEEFKGIRVFLSSLDHMHDTRKLNIVFAGGGDIAKYNKHIQILKSRYSIMFTRIVPFEKMIDYYRKSKIVVVPSVWPEPCGRVIIEAMSGGACVISTDRGGTPELITHGVNGILITPSNHIVLAKTLTHLLSSAKEIQKLGAAAYSYARNNFRAVTLAKQYIDVYTDVLKQS